MQWYARLCVTVGAGAECQERPDTHRVLVRMAQWRDSRGQIVYLPSRPYGTLI